VDFWHQWLGKPHGFRADPDCSDNCDCLIMLVKVRRALGMEVPSDQELDKLLTLSEQLKFEEIDAEIAEHLVEMQEPEDGFFIIMNAVDHVGVSVFIDQGLLCVNSRRGVRWVPGSSLRTLKWFDWR